MTIFSVYTCIPTWYIVGLELLNHEVDKAPAVGITAHHRESLGGRIYVIVTAHCIQDWLLCNKVLGTKAVYQSQTVDSIASELKEYIFYRE